MVKQETARREERGDPLVIQATWDLSPLLCHPDIETAMRIEQQKIEAATDAFVAKWKPIEELTDPTILKVALDDYEQLVRNHGTIGNIGYYFDLQLNLDQHNPSIKAHVIKIAEFGRKMSDKQRFFSHRVAHIPVDKRQQLLKHPGLSEYTHYLERKWEHEKYLLSEDEERIMMLKAPTSHKKWVKMTAEFISKAERDVLLEDGTRDIRPFSILYSEGLLSSQIKAVRDSAANAINDIFATYADVAEMEINAILENKKGDDQLRGYTRPDAERLLRDDMSPQVVDSLLEAVSKRFDIARRYYHLKARLLGVRQLEYHERNLEISDTNEIFSFFDAATIVLSVLTELDPEFGHIAKHLLKNGQIDVFPKKGKKHGAFVTYDRIPVPIYMSLNYTGKSRDTTTLAHELGHAIKDEIMKKKQHELNFASSKATAEVASTFMEDFVFQRLLHNNTNEQRLTLMMNKLNDDVSTVFRPVAIYKFEQELHEQFKAKGYLSKDEIGAIYKKHMVSYMGESVIQSPGSENWWIAIPHIRNFFYVYSYASGALISKSLQSSTKEDPAFIDKIKEFLGAGISDSPQNIFHKLGIDIANPIFWDSGLDEIEGLLAEAEQLAIDLKK